MRQIKEIIIHCSATKEGTNVPPSMIKSWHLARGFSDIGYHYVITLDGRVHVCRPENKQGAHCKGRNKHSIGICYVGGLDANGKPKDTRTNLQKQALILICRELRYKYGNIPIRGHYEFANKACPCFDVSELDDVMPLAPMTEPVI